MSKYARRGLIGLLARLSASYPLAMTQETTARLALGALLGVAHSLAFRSAPSAYADSGMTAAALGVSALWLFVLGMGVLLPILLA